MKEKLSLLKNEVQKHDNRSMDAIIRLLEGYLSQLSKYFLSNDITNEFMMNKGKNDLFTSFQDMFGENLMSENASMQRLMIDINTLSRSTWYLKKKDETILTGEDLYQSLGVYMALKEERTEIFSSKKDEQLWSDYWERVGDLGPNPHTEDDFHDGYLHDHFTSKPILKLPIETKKEIIIARGYEKPDTIAEMISLIKIHARSNRETLCSFEYRNSNIDIQKSRLDVFWKKYFNIDINWEVLKIPEVSLVTEYPLNPISFQPFSKEETRWAKPDTVLEYIPQGITCTEILSVYEQNFPNSSRKIPEGASDAEIIKDVFTYDSGLDLLTYWTKKEWDKLLVFYDKRNEKRIIRHLGVRNSGSVYSEKWSWPESRLFGSKNIGQNKHVQLMNPIEYFIAYFRFRTETGQKYDTESNTIFNISEPLVESYDFESPIRSDNFFSRPGYWCGNGRRISNDPHVFHANGFRQVFF
jgi:hypothetical protein